MGLVSVVLLAGLLLLEGASLLVPGGLAVVAVVVTLVKSRMRSAAR
jgi:hypothetical protein